ncbi:MAG TPA: hypothetical protein VED24_02385, partial [Candidatus Acidoferrum sp.]|nr:hypothetical protein [Candidatus Acidoferrum sp.]
MQVHEEFKRVVERVVSAGWQLSTDAFELVQTAVNRLDQDKLADELIAAANRQPTGQHLIDRNLTEQVLNHLLPPAQTIPIPEPVRAGAPVAAQIESQLKVLKDPSKALTSSGSMQDFSLYFRDRFMKVHEILRQRS